MRIGRVYSGTFENVPVTASQDLFTILPASNKPVAMHYLELTQITEVGEAQEEWLRIKIIRGHTTAASGGSALTARALTPGDAAAGATVRANDTTIASGGTAVDLHATAFPVRQGLFYLPPPELRPSVANAEILAIRLMAAPIDSVTMTGTILFEELI